MTQATVDFQIKQLIDLASTWEAKRDAEEYESRLYWLYHDRAVAMHEAARSLMPAGS